MITEQKENFPELKDIATDEEGYLEIEAYFLSVIIERYIENLTRLEQYEIYKSAYENGVIVEWQLKKKDPHAEIKAQYEEALNKYDVVKVFENHKGNNETIPMWYEINIENIRETHHNEVRCYNIDWNKLLSWSYANGEFVECEFANFRTFENVKTHKILAYDGRSFCANNMNGDWFANCRLAPNVTIKDEWIKEVK